MSRPTPAMDASYLLGRAVRTPWYHIHWWHKFPQRVFRWTPTKSTAYAVYMEHQEKVFCRCGAVTWCVPNYCGDLNCEVAYWELVK